MRVRAFVQDDAHIFCTEAQILPETAAFIDLLQQIYADFGFAEILVKLSTRPEKRIGSDDVWDKAEAALAEALAAKGLIYDLQPGEGAFYGAEDRILAQGLPWAGLAMWHVAARFRTAAAPRCALRRRRQRAPHRR
jgi:threonyl-tRNA synthetase